MGEFVISGLKNQGLVEYVVGNDELCRLMGPRWKV